MIELEEQKYLDYVLNIINEELASSNKTMKEVAKTSLSLSGDDKKRGDQFILNVRATQVSEKRESLKKSMGTPYFGRIDFAEGESPDKKKYYIGRKGIVYDTETVVTDWRAPISSLYYDSEVGDVEYISPNGIVKGNMDLKRQINIKDGKLIDVLDTSLVTNDELLKPYLSQNADNKMKTIVASIQREQNYIIRKPIYNNLIIQGVAGSGKTSVALHRISYLLYILDKKIHANEFLVIGPNKYFLNYISSILPELETSQVDQKTYFEILNEMLKEKLSLDNQNDTDKMTNKINKFKTSLEYKEAIDKFIDDYLDKYMVKEGIKIDGEEIFGIQEIKKLLFAKRHHYPNFSNASNYVVKKYKNNMDSIYEALNKKYRNIYINLPDNDIRRKEAIIKSEELYDFVKNKGIKYIKDYFKKMDIKITELYKIFIENIEKYTDELNEDEIKKIKFSTLDLIKHKKISFEDMAALLHINYRLHGNKEQYHNIVVDEAQDYGLFHLSVLKELFPNSTYSIYGDLAQAIYSYRSVENWECVVDSVFNGDCELININRSYRTTAEITYNANKILDILKLPFANPVIRHGDEVVFSNNKDNEYKINKIKELIKKGFKTVAVICKDSNESKEVYKALQKSISVTHISAKDSEYNGGVCVLTSALAKGLEFDAVIINDASSYKYDVDDKVDMHLLYVACTRALHYLEILYYNDICGAFTIK